MRTLMAAAALATAAVCAGAGPAARGDVAPKDKRGAAPDLSLSQPIRPSDGYGDVRQASNLGGEGKWEAGRAFVAQLRARQAEKRSLEERQSVDMAEFALLRHDMKANRARCVECLKSVYDAGCTSFWGWAAYSYLKELGEDVPLPPKDPLRGLGAFGDGVVNLEPKRLEPDVGRRMSNADWLAAATKKVPIRTPADLKPGSPVRRAILRKRLVEICGEKKILEMLAVKGGRKLLVRLWDDDATLEDFLLSGPVFDAPLALETLMTLFLNDEDEKWSRTEMGRRATVAVAVNARKGDDMKATVRHWAAFRRIGKVGGFLKLAERHDCREWRFVVRRPADAAETLYLNAQRRFPTRYVTNVSIRNVPYRKINCFGVSKWAKGDAYMRPWTASGWPRLYLRSRVGGVCVELSNWASRAANSQGIMAVTNHQPGRRATKFRKGAPPHLCWAMRREDGGWRLVNGIRPYSGSSFTLWGRGFQYLQATERAFADRTAHDESELLLFAGRVKEAAMRCPYNYTAWRAYANTLKTANASIDEWRNYLGELVRLQPEGRLATWNFAHEALDAMQKKGMDKTALAKDTAKVFLALPQPKSRIAEEMNFWRDALARALGRFKGQPVLEDKILAVALEANKASPGYLPQIFGYALERFGKDKDRLERLFSYAASFGNRNGEPTSAKATAGKQGTGKGERGFNWRRLFTMGDFRTDRTAFRMLANFRNESEPPAGTAKVPETDYDAPLVSDDALVLVSSSGKGDTPEDYARASDATPYDPSRNGLFATRSEDAPWAIVELAGSVKVSGVTVVGTAKGLSFWLSDDGEEWRKVGESASAEAAADERQAGNGVRVDLRKDSPTAKFVKVGYEPGGGKRPLALKKVLVYGNKLY
ncbi:MAG: hypothetical protein J6T51_02280 [Kiritimatiellae bacterium]|nr:hypothetical protein [Kiritimatiellia bacterium]